MSPSLTARLNWLPTFFRRVRGTSLKSLKFHRAARNAHFDCCGRRGLPCQEKPGSIFFGVFSPRICFCDWDSSAGSASFLCGWEIYLESSKTTAVFILEFWLMLTRNNSIICMSAESRLNPERSLNYSDSTGLIPMSLYHPLAPVKPHQIVPFFIK